MSVEIFSFIWNVAIYFTFPLEFKANSYIYHANICDHVKADSLSNFIKYFKKLKQFMDLQSESALCYFWLFFLLL